MKTTTKVGLVLGLVCALGAREAAAQLTLPFSGSCNAATQTCFYVTTTGANATAIGGVGYIGLYGAGQFKGGMFTSNAAGGLGLEATSTNGAAGRFDSVNADSITAYAHAAGKAGIISLHDGSNGYAGFFSSPNGVGVQGYSASPTGWAGYFQGRVFLSNGYVMSDPARKLNMQLLGSTFDRLKRVNVYSYDWQDGHDGNLQFGVDASQIADVFPNLVTTDQDHLLAVNYFGFIPILIKQAQDADAAAAADRAELVATKALVASLAARIDALEAAAPTKGDMLGGGCSIGGGTPGGLLLALLVSGFAVLVYRRRRQSA